MIVVNDNGEFERSWNEIYASELVLEKENQTDQSATFLDLAIHINNKGLTIKSMTRGMGLKCATKTLK